MPQSEKKAVFLDRDGTLNVEKGYIGNLDDIELYEGVAQAIRRLNDAGYLCILTTNQTGPARGYYDEGHVQALNQRVCRLLDEQAGARLDAVYYCPHLGPAAGGVVEPYNIDCTCRKPATGMIDEACRQLGPVDRRHSWVVGDKATDVEFGHNAGMNSVLLLSGYGLRVLAGEYQVLKQPPTLVARRLPDAVASIIEGSKKQVSV